VEDPVIHEHGDEGHSYQECLLSDREFIERVGEEAAKRIAWALDHPEEARLRFRKPGTEQDPTR